MDPRRPMEEIRQELDWLEIEAELFDDNILEAIRIEHRRREVIAELYGTIATETRL